MLNWLKSVAGFIAAAALTFVSIMALRSAARRNDTAVGLYRLADDEIERDADRAVALMNAAEHEAARGAEIVDKATARIERARKLSDAETIDSIVDRWR